jgi:adenylate cyclase
LSSQLRSFWAEVKSRKVHRTALVYIVVGIGFLEGADLILPALDVPDWAYRLAVGLVILGFPAVLIMSWALDIVPGRAHASAASAQSGPVATIQPEDPTADERPDPKSIAVLPFLNLSADPDSEYFSDGITDDIIASLSRVPELKVTSRTSAMQYKGVAEHVKKIGRDLGVAAVVEGSVRRAGGRVRIVAQAIDARTDEHLWSETYDRELEDIFEIQSDVAQRVCDAMQANISNNQSSSLGEHGTADLKAYDLFLKGRFLWNQRTAAALRRSLRYFSEAIERDPDFALASRIPTSPSASMAQTHLMS